VTDVGKCQIKIVILVGPHKQNTHIPLPGV